MNKYTIYCTPEQTKKALELGAPIDFRNGDRPYISVDYLNKKGQLLCHNYDLPTAEQMIGWIEEQSIKEVSIYCDVTGLNWSFEGYKDNGGYAFAGRDSYTSRKEATLAAIDAALGYLTDNKK